MTDRIDINIKSSYDASGAKAALRDAEALTRAQPRGGGGPAAPRGGADPAAQAAKAERAILAQAQAEARLQVVTGDLAGAQQTLGTAIGRLPPGSMAATRALTSLAQVENKITAEATRAAAAQEKAAAASQKLVQSSGGLSGQIATVAKSVEQLATGLAGMRAIQVIDDLSRTAANADLVRRRFDQLAESAGTTGDAILGALRSASGGEIADMSLQLAANKAALLGVADSAGEMGVLMEIARDRAQAMGISTEFAFDSIVTGLGRGSALILDNIGITVEVTEVNEAYARSIGKTVAQLTEAEKKQALINAVVAQGRDTIAATGGAVETAAANYARFDAAVANAKVALGGLAGITLAPVAEDAANLVNALTGVGSASDGIGSLANQMTQFIPGTAMMRDLHDAANDAFGAVGRFVGLDIAPDFSPLQASVDAWKDLLGIQSEAEAQAASTTAASDQVTAAVSYQSPAMIAASEATQQASEAAQAASAAIASHTVLVSDSSGKLVELAEVTRESALQSQIDSEAKQLQAQQTQVLTQQAALAVDEFLRLNPGIDAAGIAALVTAGKIDPLLGQLAAMRVQAFQARDALLALANAQNVAAVGQAVASNRAAGRMGRGDSASEMQGQDQAWTRINQERAEAQREQIMATGTAAQQQAILNAELAKANQLYGGNSAAAIQAQTKLAQFQASQAKGGGGGGGGASIGSKLEDTRIKEMQQTEDAELAHRKRLLDIEKDYAEQSAKIGRENEVSKRQSRAGFYDDLSKATADIGGEAAQQLSAEYEAAFAKSQEFAAKGQNQLAKEYLKTRQEQLRDEVDYQQELAEARKDGNTDEVQRLEAIHTLQQDAAREELALVEQGGDSVQNARKEALDAEALKYEESLGKIADTADRKEAQIVGSFETQASAADAWADAMVAAAGRVDTALGKVKGPTTGTGSTEGDGVPTGGDGGGGRGISGGGRAAGGGGGAVVTLTEAHAILDMILALGGIAKEYIKPIELYKQTLGTAIELLTAAADFHTAAQAAATSPISPALVQQLVDEARWVLDLTRNALVPTNERQVEIFERYASTVQSSIGVLSDMADLRQTLSEAFRNSSPFDVAAVSWLAQRAQESTALVMAQLIPLTEKQAEGIDRYATGVGAAVDIIGGLAGLRQTVTEAMEESAPFKSEEIGFLAFRAREIMGLVQNQLVPTTEATAAGFDAYATSVGASVEIIGGLAGLRQTVTEAMEESAPFDSKQIAWLAFRAKEITALVRGQLIPLTEDQSEEVQRYADAVMASAQALKAPLDLSGNLFADYVSPSNAQIDMVANDAKRFVDRLAQAAKTYSKEGLEAAKAYAEGVGATFTAAKDGLLFFDALRSGDFTPQPAALAQFEAGTMALMDTAARLGARAATIPASDIAALGSVTAVLNEQASMLINMSAVPFGNLGAMAGGYGGQQTSAAGGSSGTTYNVNIYNPPAGMDVGAVVRQVKEVMRQETITRRS